MALVVIIVICGSASLVTARVLVADFRRSAQHVEREATAAAQLRADVVDHSVALGQEISSTSAALTVARLETVVRAEFVDLAGGETSPAASALIAEARARWEALVSETAAAPDLASRGAAVTALAPEVLLLLDRSGLASRTAVRADLHGSADFERVALGALVALQLLAIGLAVQLARRLSREVLKPVGVLSDSANRLAAGELHHHISVDRDDELGQLAVSFNAMADAVAGSQRTLTREANSDSLTGLANRAGFSARLASALVVPEHRSAQQAVLFADLDDFKDVNDTLGHAAGDELLREAAARLSAAVRPGDVVARLGGDEFAIFLDGLDDAHEAFDVAHRVLDAFGPPVMLGLSSVRVETSVGLAHRRPSSTPAELMHDADVAMYAAKAKGKNRVEAYDARLDELTKTRHLLRGGITTAVELEQLVVDYQPVIDLDSGIVKGVEALVRWQHPELGLLPPGAFIDLAEETGAIIGIGAWVLETAARQLGSWQHRYQLPRLWCSVNVSMRQFDGPGFATTVTKVLAATELDPTTLVIEVTESVLADPHGHAAAGLEAIRELGVRIALDDFGTGYSSISYLRQLPVDIIKIDQSFTTDSEPGKPGNALLEAIIVMSQHLGLDVIPEGIEDIAQLTTLRDLGCRVGQGFLLARPTNPAAIDELLTHPHPVARRFMVDPGRLAGTPRRRDLGRRPTERAGDHVATRVSRLTMGHLERVRPTS